MTDDTDPWGGTGGFKHIVEEVQLSVARFAIETATGDWELLSGNDAGMTYYSPSRRQLAQRHYQSDTVALATLDNDYVIESLVVTFREKDREPEDGLARKWHGENASLCSTMLKSRQNEEPKAG